MTPSSNQTLPIESGVFFNVLVGSPVSCRSADDGQLSVRRSENDILEHVMEAVIQLRTDVARLMRSGAASDERADQLVRLKEELDKELARLGVSLRPMHPGAEDAESMRYFLLSGMSELGKEEVLPTLRGLEAVTAAYVKPEAEPA